MDEGETSAEHCLRCIGENHLPKAIALLREALKSEDGVRTRKVSQAMGEIAAAEDHAKPYPSEEVRGLAGDLREARKSLWRAKMGGNGTVVGPVLSKLEELDAGIPAMLEREGSVEGLIALVDKRVSDSMEPSEADLVNEAGRSLRQDKESPEIPSVSAALDPIAKPGADWLGISPRTISEFIGIPIITGLGYAGVGFFLTPLGRKLVGTLGGLLGLTATGTGLVAGRAKEDALLFSGVSFAQIADPTPETMRELSANLEQLQEGIREGDLSKIGGAFISEGSTSDLADEMERALSGTSPAPEAGGEGEGEEEGEEEGFREVTGGRFEMHEEEEEAPATSPGAGKFQVFQE